MEMQSNNNNKSGLGGLIGIVVGFGVVIFLVMSAFAPGTKGGNAWSYLAGGNTGNASQSSQAPATGSSVVGGPSLSAAQINAILHAAVSPADGTGQDLYNLSAQYHIDDAFAAAVFKRESNYGKKGVANSSLSLGNLRCIPGAACVGGYAYFNSWQDGYAAFYKLIAGPLYVGAGLTTPDQIMKRYAPVGDNNDPSGYAADVDATVAAWRAS